MKALPFKIPYGGERSIQVEHERLAQFYGQYHTHEELQLTLIVQGNGFAYIGDQIIQYNPGDVLLLGPKLPHVFKNEPDNSNGVEAISVFFLPDFLGADFMKIPESRAIKQLLEDASRGLRLSGKPASKAGGLIKELLALEGLNRLLFLLQILQFVAMGKHKYITGPDYHRPRRSTDGEKINNVFNYLTTHYNQEISLAKVADIAHMSPTAFCRYFKQHTRKSYTRFLNEIRVSQACKLLKENNEAIGQVAYQTGFNNISNFNRQFKKITGTTPSNYQKLPL